MPSVNGFTVVCEYSIKVTLYFAKFVTNYYRPRVILPVTISHQLAEEYSLEQMEKDELEKALIISQIEANEKEEMKARINMFGDNSGSNNNMIRNDDDAAAPEGPMMMYHQQDNEQQLNYSVPLPNSNNLPSDIDIQNNLIQSQVGNNHGVNISEYNQNGDGMVQEELEKNFYPQIEMNNNNNANNNNRNNKNYLDINHM
jgi:hypothetical protein